MMLQLRHVDVWFRKPIITGLVAAFNSGCVHLITGENGSGKSTVLRAIVGLVPLRSGQICLGDRWMSNWGADWYHQVAWVPDTPALLPDLTVVEMMRLGQTGREVSDSALSASIDLMGLGTVADTACGLLSLGYRQRLSIAMATAAPRPVIVMDEPTQAVDSDTVDRIKTAIHIWSSQGAIVVIASHDTAALSACSDNLYRLQGGRLVQVAR